MDNFDKSICFDAGRTKEECDNLIDAINHNCDNINFDRIPLMYTYNNYMNTWELYTTTQYVKALEYCLKDMYWN